MTIDFINKKYMGYESFFFFLYTSQIQIKKKQQH